MSNRKVMLAVKHLLGVGNAACAIWSLAGGIFSTAVVNIVAMLYISTMYIPPREGE